MARRRLPAATCLRSDAPALVREDWRHPSAAYTLALVDALRSTLQSIVTDAQNVGVPIVTLGAFAVRAYMRHPDQRKTNDLDLFTHSASFPALQKILVAHGFRVFPSGPWWRGEAAGPPRLVVDVAVDAVVDLRSFDRYAVDVRAARERNEGGAPLPVPSLEDLLALKLLAARDKDILDVAALMMDRGSEIDAAAFLRRIEEQDLEIPIRRGCLHVISAQTSGELARLWKQRTGASPDPASLARAIEALQALFEAPK